MPLTSAIQSAMAIRHERERREQRRLSKIRRESGRPSLEGDVEEVLMAPSNRSDSSLTTFHMGVVFILLGTLNNSLTMLKAFCNYFSIVQLVKHS